MTELKIEEQDVLKGYVMMLYFSGTMIMFDPSQECIYDFWTKGILKTLPVRSSNPEFIRAASLLRESSCNSLNKLSLMQEDFKRLFVNSVKPLAPPVESVYRNISDKGGKEKLRNELTALYDKYTWSSSFRGRVQEDHLGIELLFLTHLTEEYVKAKGIKKKKTAADLVDFIDRHLLSWLPVWREDVNKHSITLGYKGIASLIIASAEDIRSVADNNPAR